MASRIFWIMIAVMALVIGMFLQDGPRMWTWAAETGVSTSTQEAIEAKVDRAIDRGFDNIDTVEADGREIQVSPEMKRALAASVSELVKAETDYAMLKATNGSAEAIRAAEARRNAARSEIDRLKAEIKGQDAAAAAEQGAVQESVRAQIREEVRDSVREAVKN